MPNDFSSRAGTAMTAVAWVLFLAFLFTTFDYFIEQRNNPNQNVLTIGDGKKKQITLQRNAYGHYITNGTINNQQVVFLLDTGATEIAIPEAIADKIGLIKNQPIRIKTANGTATAYRTKIDSAAVGEIKLHNLSATILKNMPGNEVLLGMNFLKHFEIIQKGKFLTIKQ
jgi:aspartyl protease family protein